MNTNDIDSDADNVNDDIIGGDDVTDNTGGDEDDHDFAQVPVAQEFDLALITTLNGSTAGPFEPGSTVKFDMEVFNQGSIDAYDVQVTNYVPMGLTLADANWTLSGTEATPLTDIAYIAAGESEVITITYTIDADYQGTTIRDWAEISFATDTDGGLVNTTDIDSQADNDQFTGAGETDDLLEDNVVDNTGGDEDDHDPVEIAVEQTFDLALSQQYASYVDNDGDGAISAGDDVVFNITVYNQGTLDANDVDVVNYVPSDMNFVAADNPTWDAGTITQNVWDLASGTDTTFSIVLEIDAAFQGSSIINWAEISA